MGSVRDVGGVKKIEMNILSLKIAVLISVSCLISLGCSRPSTNANVVPPAPANNSNSIAKVDHTPAPRETGAYPQEVVDEFIKSCQGAGSSAKLCTCLIDKIQEKYSFEDFNVIELKLGSGNPPEEFVEFAGRAKAGCMR